MKLSYTLHTALSLALAGLMLTAGCARSENQVNRPSPQPAQLRGQTTPSLSSQKKMAPKSEYDLYMYAEEKEALPMVATDSMQKDDSTVHNTEEYNRIYENNFKTVIKDPLSTFSIDVDTASYANVRRMLNYGQLPSPDAVRIEEMINYFSYDYPEPTTEAPFSFNTELSECPWNRDHKLLAIGLQAVKVDLEKMPPNNLVFLLDVSGSMSDPNKLPLLKGALKLLAGQMRAIDTISIVVYAGAAGLVLPPTAGSQTREIFAALEKLEAGGSTAGGAGIELAYATAKKHFNQQGNNRVILCTDGDFNVGTSATGDLVRLIEEKRKDGIFLTVLGFGMGNYKDSRMEQLADKGNGNYAYIDSIMEAKKVLVTEMGGTLLTIAKDVKIQIEFNPAVVKEYRLIGYENRVMANEDFDNDQKDADELGAGHTVTALYEIVLQDGKTAQNDLKYQTVTVNPEALKGKDLLTIKFRYKKPDGNKSILIEHPVPYALKDLKTASDNFRWTAAVAQWGLLLRDSEHKGSASFENVLSLAKSGKGQDVHGYRKEFIQLVEISQGLKK